MLHCGGQLFLPLVEHWFPESAPHTVQQGGERDGPLLGAGLWQRDDHVHLLLRWQLCLLLHVLEELEKRPKRQRGCRAEQLG